MAHARSLHTADTHQHLASDLGLTVLIGRVCCDACAVLVEQRLRDNPHVVGVQVNAAQGLAHVDAQAGLTSVEELARLAGECCGDRCPVPMPDAAVSSHHHMLGALAMSASS